MMSTTVGGSAVIVLLLFSIACGPSRATSPSGASSSPSATNQPTPRPRIDFPPLSGPSRTFIFDDELSYPVSSFTRQSRFVLYDNGACLLQYPPSSIGDGRIPGAYRDANGVIMFLFNSSTGRSADEAWDDAIGTLKGDSLTIRYAEGMHQADFEDAVYVLMR